MFTTKVKHKRQVKNIGQLSTNYIEESELPVKLFVVGPTEAGKTTTVASMLRYIEKQEMPQSSWLSSSTGAFEHQEWRKKYIAENSSTRTIGLAIHNMKMTKDILAIVYDLGGNETFYALQAIFLDLKYGFFLVTIDVRESKKIMEQKIEEHLAIISSKLPKDVMAQSVLVFTHCDMLESKERDEKIRICKRIRLTKSKENIKFVKAMFIDALNAESEEMRELVEVCMEMANNVKRSMV